MVGSDVPVDPKHHAGSFEAEEEVRRAILASAADAMMFENAPERHRRARAA